MTSRCPTRAVAGEPRSSDRAQTPPRQIECGGDILRLHSRAELPGDNEAREVVQHGGEIVPAPPRDLEVGEVGLPELVDGSGLVFELVRRLDNDVGRARDEIVRFSPR